MTFDTGANNIAFANVVGNSGAGGMTKLGSGALTLSAANTFTGGVIFMAGTLNINNSQALGTVTGTFTIAGGTINNSSAGAVTTLNYPQVWSGDFTFTGTQNLNLGTGAATLTSNRSVTANAGNITIGGAINCAGFDLTLAGSGNIIFNGSVSALNNLTFSGTGTKTPPATLQLPAIGRVAAPRH